MSNIQKIEASPLINELRHIYALVKDLDEEEILGSSAPELQGAFERLDEIAALEVDENSIEAILKITEFDSFLSVISCFRFS